MPSTKLAKYQRMETTGTRDAEHHLGAWVAQFARRITLGAGVLLAAITAPLAALARLRARLCGERVFRRKSSHTQRDNIGHRRG